MAILEQSFDGAKIKAALIRHFDDVLIGFGVLLRLRVYLADRPYWMDEGSLVGSLTMRPIFKFDQPLANTQLAPPGFIVVERIVAATLGHSPMRMRLFPFLCGILAVFLFSILCRKTLPRQAGLIALGLFACSYDINYFASELKQYSSDLAIALVCTISGLFLIERWTLSRYGLLICTAVIAPWFSHPSVFVIAGVGLVVVARFGVEESYQELKLCIAAGILGAISFLGSYFVSMRLLLSRENMWGFWDFALLRNPLPGWPNTREFGFQMTELLVNPCNLISADVPNLSLIVVIVLICVASICMIKSNWWTFALLVAPVLVTMTASFLRYYPFHGRLILFLTPTIFLLVGTGIDGLSKIVGSRVVTALLIIFLLIPTARSIFDYEVYQVERVYSPYGDIHANPIERPTPSS